MTSVPPLGALLRHGLAGGHEVILVAADGQPVARAAFHAMVSASRVALRRHGDPRGRRIALHGTITPPLVAGLVAGLLDGAVVVPLDADLPDLRKATMVELAETRLVLDFAGGAAAFASVATIVDASAADWLAGADTSVVSELSGPALEPGAPCYIFFTSGTTGTPKGVLGRRGGLAHFLAWETGFLPVAPGDRVSILTRLSFDVVLRDLLAPIVGRATGCIAPRDLGPGAMLDWLDARAITVTHVVPSLARSFLAATRPGFTGGALHHSLFAGEPLTGSLVRRWRAAFPHTEIYNLYGPTETTLAKFCARIAPSAADDVMPCGYPLPDTEAIIVGAHGALAAAGDTGEVAIATPHRSLGYLDPGQTRERFVRIGDRHVYLTGDLGFIAPDGQLHLRGRKDDQVKILGVRIELAGVAAAIHAFDGVSDAAVICVAAPGAEADTHDKRLIAYFTAPVNGAAIAQALRPYLADRLPPAAIPSRFIELPAMPLTANGKLDRSRLPAPADDAAAAPIAPIANEREQVIVEAFAAQLGRSEVGPLDDFFALGGDSLAAAAVCAAIQRRLGAYLAPAELLSAATPRALAERVRAAAPPAPIPRAPVQRYFALTPQQRRYFRTFCAGGNRSWCNMVALIALPAGTTRGSLEDALADILARHDSLRLAFRFDDSGTVQQSIDFSWDPLIAELDLTALAPDDARDAIGRLRVAEAERPIPLMNRGPLFRAQLILLAGGQRTLLWTVHHLVSDGTSQGILARELTDVLTGRRSGEAERFAAPSFVDVAAWAAERPGLEAARSYFRAVFAAPYRHPYLHAHPGADDPQRCYALERAAPAAVRGRAHELARAHRTTPYAIWLAAVFRLWARRTGTTDLTILTPLAGREHPQIAPLIGDLINLVALRVSQLPSPAARLIHAVKQQVRDAARHQVFQFDELLDEFGVAFDPDRNPLSGLSLNFMPQTGRMPPPAEAVTDKGYKLKYDVLFLVRDYEDATGLEIQFRGGLLDRVEAASLFDELWLATEGFDAMTEASRSRAQEFSLLVLLALLWGGAFTLIKIAVAGYPPATLVAIRITIGGLLLAAFALAQGHAFPRDRGTWLRLLVQGALQSAIPFTLISWGETRIDSGLAGVVNATPPMFVFVISAFVLGTVPAVLPKLAGVVLGLVGVAVIAGVGSASFAGASVLAVLAVLTASLCYALGAIHGHRFTQLSAFVTASGSLLMGSLFMIPISLAVDRPWTLAPAPSATLAVLALAVFSTAGGSLLFFRLLKTLGPLATTSNAYLRALWSVVLGVVLLGEPLTIGIVAGGLLVLVGVPLVTGQIRLPASLARAARPAG